ncbi:MAG: hypothetical protein K0R28_4623, partial [Paenibacillus sp.]|nr:hypothetical protein [Paenibacillus sp.]
MLANGTQAYRGTMTGGCSMKRWADSRTLFELDSRRRPCMISSRERIGYTGGRTVELLIGLSGSLLIAGAAYLKRSLSASGFAAAVILGTAMYTLGSAVWFGSLIAFFLSSTLLSKWKKKTKEKAESGYEKSGRRDAGQVAANGGLALLLCVVNAWWPHPVWWYAFLGVMASVNADTWATEIGGLSKTPPRSIVSGRRVAAGTSGAV